MSYYEPEAKCSRCRCSSGLVLQADGTFVCRDQKQCKNKTDFQDDLYSRKYHEKTC